LTTLFWGAAGWHRFILLGEAATALLPHWPKDAVSAYFWRWLIVGVFSVVALFVCRLAFRLQRRFMGIASRNVRYTDLFCPTACGKASV
jgi:hypothetical protein